ncbi:MAG TPA: heavy metal translocating P-type ATPase metal-binding domain-containing protein, partial [Bdellovibrionales bacterium]|nr:heavy metal translocating P-type ATPase metal-binding domain-containing protein [Bdellovibrionales bacterium]
MENAIALPSQPLHCKHCGDTLDTAAQGRFGEFCCAGCRAVYSVLQQNGLGDFYKYTTVTALEKPRDDQAYGFIDDLAFQKAYVNRPRTMRFFVPGLDCTACVWLIDQIPSRCGLIESIKTDFFNSSIDVVIKDGAKFSEAAAALYSFGLNPSPIRFNEETRRLAAKESRTALARIAVAALGTGNIMLLSISVYAGAEGTLKDVFEWLMFLLAAPVFTYSAYPFYKNSWSWLKAGKIHLDLPISLAIWAGAIVSIYHLLEGGSELYFDSLSMLVFLLLGSRYLLKSVQGRLTGKLPIANFVYAVPARRPGGRTVSSLALQAGDFAEIDAGEAIPADGVVVAGTGWADTSALTGEAQAQKVGAGDQVFAGTRLAEGAVTARVTAPVADSRVTKLLEAVESSEISKNALTGTADLWARRFLAAIFAVSALTIVYFALRGEPSTGLYRALTVMIVTCPCVFAMAIPWTYNLAIRAAAARGLLVKNSEIFERLTQAREVIFDKTGTLTQGYMDVQRFETLRPEPRLETAIWALERASSHPVAKAICRFLEARGAGQESATGEPAVRLLEGGGLEGRLFGARWTIAPVGQSPEFDGLAIAVSKDGELAARFTLADTPRADAREAIEKLRALYPSVVMLSGDRPEVAKQIARGLGITEVHAGQSPESKLAFVRGRPASLMVGDGNNDAPALKASFGSIAVLGSLEASLKAADVYLTRPGLLPLVELAEL